VDLRHIATLVFDPKATSLEDPRSSVQAKIPGPCRDSEEEKMEELVRRPPLERLKSSKAASLGASDIEMYQA